jgi:hypothetical protein
MSPLPVEPAVRLADGAQERRRLVISLWSEQAVEPKCCKSVTAQVSDPYGWLGSGHSERI